LINRWSQDGQDVRPPRSGSDVPLGFEDHPMVGLGLLEVMFDFPNGKSTMTGEPFRELLSLLIWSPF
jgi:hypothetical protein